MRKSLTFVLALMFISFTGVSQLQNPGFEVYSSLPDGTGQYYVSSSWNNANSNLGSPDYFHYAGSVASDLPETPIAMVDAYEGNAIMGFVACGAEHSDFREYLSTKLTSPLNIGSEYLVSFRMTNGELTAVSQAGLATSHIGLHFNVQDLIQTDNQPLDVTPQYSVDSVFFSRDWHLIQFIFTADQAYEYMFVGLFGQDAEHSIEIRDGNNPQFGYYFLDDFYMEEIDEDYDPTTVHLGRKEEDNPEVIVDYPSPEIVFDESEFYIPNAFTPNGDGDNDSFRPVSPNVNDYTFEVFSRWGQLIYSTTDPEQGWNGKVHGVRAKEGVYVWQISYSERDKKKEFVEKQQRGTVSLLR
jgi:gliding motility-associated-like protein